MMYWQLSEIVDDLKDEEPLLDSILTHMGNMYEKLENFEMSICLYGRAVKVVERLYGKSSYFFHFIVVAYCMSGYICVRWWCCLCS